MSAIQSLLRVMTHRDAEAIVLEAGKVPSLRRKGQVEQLMMPPIEARLIDDFVAPLVDHAPASEWPSSVPFVDEDGTAYHVGIEKVTTGTRLVVRKAKAQTSAPAAAPPTSTSKAWWAAKPGAAAAPVATPTAAAPATVGSAPAPASDATRADGLARASHILAQLLPLARDHGAADVLVSTRQPPRMRVDGRLEPLDAQVDDAMLAACVAALVTADGSADFSLEIDGSRVRVNAFSHLGGHALAARLIRDRAPSLTELALPGELGSIVDHRDGLVVVCGPTGSGKSTTLAALIELLDSRRAAHVITLEDPIEFRFQPRRCMIHQREIGAHASTFAAGLRAALREAPDVILLGELRDRETIAAALTAAETGHLVLATLHAPSAAGAVDRMIDVFPDGAQRQVRWQLASVLRTVVTQYLLPRRDGGRAVAAEIVPVTAAVANIIRKGDLHTLPTAIQSGRDAGMVPLERSLARLLDSNACTRDAVRKIAADADLLAALSAKLK
jgi:twitching motility protein PilT|nr:PilT/PilU family type 4a pilus ATPase [Kofleriaceae bacterium]